MKILEGIAKVANRLWKSTAPIFDLAESELAEPFILDETRASTGCIFKGWANTPGATVPDSVVNGDTSAVLDSASKCNGSAEKESGAQKNLSAH